MSFVLRIALLIGAVAVFAYVLRKIRKSEMKIADSTFWFLFGLSLVILVVFPQLAYFLSSLLQVESPSNFVFLYVISVLLIREFVSTAEISQLRSKLAFLTQEIALKDAEAAFKAKLRRAADAGPGGEGGETEAGSREEGDQACKS